MAMSEKHIKLLWGRSGNRCAICKADLSQDSKSTIAAFTLGEQAHIVGDKEHAPRGKSSLTDTERDSYHNRILLCPTHHTEIDSNVADYPTEKLHIIKSTHELWVYETLSSSSDLKQLGKQLAITNIVDAATRLCPLRIWPSWSDRALAVLPSWDEELPDAIFEFCHKVEAAIWPADFNELERATRTMALCMHEAAQVFLQHAEHHNSAYVAVKFYNQMYPNPNYDRDLDRFQKWLDDCYFLVYQSARAANWFSDVVRRDLNPTYFAATGRFMLMDGPLEPDFRYESKLLQFSKEEKRILPQSLEIKIAEMRARYSYLRFPIRA